MQKFINLRIDTTYDDMQIVEKAIFKGDTLTLTIKVFNNGVLADLTNQIVDLVLLKSDGNSVEGVQKTISNGTITATLTQQATLCEGIVRGTLQITENSTSHISTNEFTYLVLPSIADTVLEASKSEINTLQELLLVIANNASTINEYETLVQQVGTTTQSIQALIDIKNYIDTNLLLLENENAEAIANIPALKAENDKAPTLTANLKTQNDNAEINISTLTSKNTEAVTNKNNLDASNTAALATKSALDTSKTNADTSKAALDTSIANANNAKNALDTSKTNADASKTALDISINEANDFATAHGDIIDLDNRVTQNTAQLSDIMYNPFPKLKVGISGHTVNSTLINVIKNHNFKYFRVDIQWDTIETTLGVYNFSTIDTWVNILESNGIKPYFILDYSNTLYTTEKNLVSAEVVTGYLNFITAVVTRYKNKGILWEVYNEPNLEVFWKNQDKNTPIKYGNILKQAYSIIKNIDASGYVIAPALNTIVTEDEISGLIWLKALGENGGFNYVDFISVHPYSRLNPEELISYWGELKGYIYNYSGRNIPIICGEVGYSTVPNITGLDTDPIVANETIKSNYLLRLLLINLMCGVDLTVIYEATSNRTDNANIEEWFGLFDSLYNPLGSVTNLKNFISLLGEDSVLVQSIQPSDNNYILKFRKKSGEYVDVIWTNGDNNSLAYNEKIYNFTDVPTIFESTAPNESSISLLNKMSYLHQDSLRKIEDAPGNMVNNGELFNDYSNSIVGELSHSEGKHNCVYPAYVYKISSYDSSTGYLTLNSTTNLVIGATIGIRSSWGTNIYAEISEIIGSTIKVNKSYVASWTHIFYKPDSLDVYSAHGEGVNNLASGTASHAEGSSNIVTGAQAHAEGSGNTVSSSNGHAEGNGNTVTGDNSHAEGNGNNITVQKSHAEGNGNNITSGGSSHAEGNGNTVTGYYAHAEGNGNTASGTSSHVGGEQNTASTNCATAFGFKNNATNMNSLVIGHLNKALTTTGNNSNQLGDAFVIGNGIDSSSTRSNAFRVDFSGAVYGLNAYNATGADYAEYFEWEDENTNQEDRRGYFVTLNNDRIKIANAGDYVLGVVSANPCIIGNADEDWIGKWLHDDFGGFIYEDVEEEIEQVNSETGEVTFIKTGNIIRNGRMKLNPDYDDTKEYISRKNRKEWCLVGMLGVLVVRDDGTCKVNSYCSVNNEGIATAGEKGLDTYRVVKRVNDNLIKIIFK